MTAEIKMRSSIFLGLFGISCFLAVWEIIGQFQLAGLSWPALSQVLTMLIDPSRSGLFSRALSATLMSAFNGYLAGVLIGVLFAFVAHLAPPLSKGLDRLAAVVNSVPSIAMAPIFLVLIGRNFTPAAVASVHVFFIIFVSMTSGLKATTLAHQDLFTVFGASILRRFFLLEVPASLPALVSGLRLSAPVALIGAIIGEWFGASRGLGVLIINAMQNFQITLLWCAVLLSAISSLFFYILLTTAERRAYSTFR